MGEHRHLLKSEVQLAETRTFLQLYTTRTNHA